jgi:hypothetical protein
MALWFVGGDRQADLRAGHQGMRTHVGGKSSKLYMRTRTHPSIRATGSASFGPFLCAFDAKEIESGSTSVDHSIHL